MATRERYCFVTIGATASFNSLIRAVISPNFLQALARHEYTNLLIQFGKGGQDLFTSLAEDIGRNSRTYGIKVQGFDLTTRLRETMRIASGVASRKEGIVVCHAGTGSVLDALRIGVPIIVVPNTDLLDNHQLEFTEQMAKMEYAIHGDINHLPEAIASAETLRSKIKSKPPINSGKLKTGSGLEQVLDEEMGIEIAGRIE